MTSTEIGTFAHQVTIKATIVTIVLAAILLSTGKPALPQGLAAGALADIGTFYLLAEVAYGIFLKTKHWFSALAIMGFFAFRIFMQVVVLYLALVYSSVLSLWTALLGILIVHVMILVQAVFMRIQGENQVVEGGK